jgi:hypothetical protein
MAAIAVKAARGNAQAKPAVVRTLATVSAPTPIAVREGEDAIREEPKSNAVISSLPRLSVAETSPAIGSARLQLFLLDEEDEARRSLL